jgi:hypothetical protein
MRILVLIIPFIFFLANQSQASLDGNEKAIQACLKNWKTHPFPGKSPQFRIISAKVRVFGIGGDVVDSVESKKPELILIKPNVCLMTNTTLHLMNPNGWYCLKGKVDVLGKTIIDLHCKAKLTSSNDGTTVMASNDKEDGVTVLGSSQVKRVGCEP